MCRAGKVMIDREVAAAAELLAKAWRTNIPLTGLPAASRPATLEEAFAIQDAVVAVLGEAIGGWKAGALRPARGPMCASRMHRSPARIPSNSLRLRAVEGEIAFLFNGDMPPRAEAYTRDEVASHIFACAAIEIVDSRYANYDAADDLDRMADLFSSGAFVYGTPVENWATLDLSNPRVTLSFDGSIVLERAGGHATGDPLEACVTLVNGLRGSWGVRAGQIVTTGSYTGVKVLPVGSTATMQFENLGSAEVTFTD
jgi:2-keto-4-pentenoate hydratase